MKVYLGDAVYVQLDDLGRLVLTTEDGIRATNTIVMENEVYGALLAFVKRLNSRVAWECPRCGGRGKGNFGDDMDSPYDDDETTCATCHGTGKLPQ